MTYYILLTFCIIVLIAYTFEVTVKFSKIPGVILLMLLGLALRYLATYLYINIPDLSIVLPVMGTLGLILIVLEGSLDLTISKDKKGLISKSLILSILSIITFVLLFSSILHYIFHFSFRVAMLSSIPFGIISSAVAIPSSTQLKAIDREFIIYESSFSDIIGILLFDFLLFNELPVGESIFYFLFEVFISIIVSIIISAGLAYMLNKIGHHVKYVIIITFVIMVFLLAKLIHWPSLIVVLIFGVIMNNTHLFQSRFFIKHIDFQEFNINLKSFKQITGELAFLVRSFFFLIFGFYTPIEDLFNPQNLMISLGICFAIYFLRTLFFLFIVKKPLKPLLFFAPRGLITILLFLSLPAELKLSFMTEGLIIQIIFITILMMTVGNFISSKKENKKQPEKNDKGLINDMSEQKKLYKDIL